MTTPGLLIVGHGTRDAEGVAEFFELVDLVRRNLPNVPTEPGFLELARPTIAEGLSTLVARGASDIRVMPLLLFSAGHDQRDIPAAVADAATKHSGIRVSQTECLGCDRRVVELSTRRFQESLGVAAIPLSETLLLMVGRGSSDPAANAEMCRFARLRFEETPSGWLEVAFTAIAVPTVEQGLEIASSLPFRQVVVQPHLLFRGQLFRRIHDLVRQQSRNDSKKQWICTEHLGPDARLASVICERCGF